VTYLTEEDVRQTIIAHSEATFSMEKAIAQSFLEIVTKNRLGYEGMSLHQACPHVRPMGIEEFLEKWWGEKS
jgi:hypothetical protein